MIERFGERFGFRRECRAAPVFRHFGDNRTVLDDRSFDDLTGRYSKVAARERFEPRTGITGMRSPEFRKLATTITAGTWCDLEERTHRSRAR